MCRVVGAVMLFFASAFDLELSNRRVDSGSLLVRTIVQPVQLKSPLKEHVAAVDVDCSVGAGTLSVLLEPTVNGGDQQFVSARVMALKLVFSSA